MIARHWRASAGAWLWWAATRRAEPGAVAQLRRYFVFAAGTLVLHDGSAILESASMGSTRKTAVCPGAAYAIGLYREANHVISASFFILLAVVLFLGISVYNKLTRLRNAIGNGDVVQCDFDVIDGFGVTCVAGDVGVFHFALPLVE